MFNVQKCSIDFDKNYDGLSTNEGKGVLIQIIVQNDQDKSEYGYELFIPNDCYEIQYFKSPNILGQYNTKMFESNSINGFVSMLNSLSALKIDYKAVLDFFNAEDLSKVLANLNFKKEVNQEIKNALLARKELKSSSSCLRPQ